MVPHFPLPIRATTCISNVTRGCGTIPSTRKLFVRAASNYGQLIVVSTFIGKSAASAEVFTDSRLLSDSKRPLRQVRAAPLTFTLADSRKSLITDTRSFVSVPR